MQTERRTITLVSDDLHSEVQSLEELAAELGLPFIAVLARPGSDGGAIRPVGSSVFVVGRNSDGLLETDEVVFTKTWASKKLWKRFR